MSVVAVNEKDVKPVKSGRGLTHWLAACWKKSHRIRFPQRLAHLSREGHTL
jgi:hypothetical protein